MIRFGRYSQHFQFLSINNKISSNRQNNKVVTMVLMIMDQCSTGNNGILKQKDKDLTGFKIMTH